MEPASDLPIFQLGGDAIEPPGSDASVNLAADTAQSCPPTNAKPPIAGSSPGSPVGHLNDIQLMLETDEGPPDLDAAGTPQPEETVSEKPPHPTIVNGEKEFEALAGSPKAAGTGTVRPTFELATPSGKASPLAAMTAMLHNLAGINGKIVGIDIQQHRVVLAKVARSGRHHRLLDYRLLMRQGKTPETEKGDGFWFADQLPEVFLEMVAAHETVQVWCAIAMEEVETRFLQIPRMTGKERENAIYWTTKKDISFNDADRIFDYSILGDFQIKNQLKTNFVSYLADAPTVGRYQDFFAKAGIPLTGITTHSAGTHNLFNPQWLSTSKGGSLACVYIDEHKTYIDIYAEEKLFFSREINTGLSSLSDLLHSAYHTDGTSQASLDEQSSASGFSLELFDESAIDRLVRQLGRTFEYCITSYGIAPFDSVLFSGVPAQIPAFVNYCRKELGISCTSVDPLLSGKIAFGNLFHQDILGDIIQKSRLFFSVGLTLCNRHTTHNFLHSYREKSRYRIARTTNAWILAGFAIVLFFFGASFALLQHNLNVQRASLEPLQAALQAEESSGMATTNLQAYFLNKIKAIKDLRENRLANARRFYPAVLAGEVLRLVPEHIKLTGLSIDRQQATGSRNGSVQKEIGSKYRIEMDALIRTAPPLQELTLATLLQNMKKSPIIKATAAIEEKEHRMVDNQEALRVKIIFLPGNVFSKSDEHEKI